MSLRVYFHEVVDSILLRDVWLTLIKTRFGGLMPLFSGTPSLPFSTNQATALKPRVYPLGPDQPQAAVGLSERVDFHVGELHAPLAQGPEGFDRSLEKIRAELLVCQNPADDQLHGSLRHDLHAVGRLPLFGARSQLRFRYDVGRAMSLPPCDSREARASPPIAPVAAVFHPSEYTRVRVNVQRTGGANINHPALATAGDRGTKTAPTSGHRRTEDGGAPSTSLAL